MSPVSSFISLESLSEVRGPVAIITIPFLASSAKLSSAVSFVLSDDFILFSSLFCFDFSMSSSTVLPTSCLTISTFSKLAIFSVIFSANFSLSTAKACPAGTATSSAVFIKSESNIRSSSFNKPQAFVCKFDLKELLHTISAKFLLLCAGENLLGFISYSLTFIPLFAI